MNVLFAILILFFLFQGEPDVWDNLHTWAMNITSTKGMCK